MGPGLTTIQDMKNQQGIQTFGHHLHQWKTGTSVHMHLLPCLLLLAFVSKNSIKNANILRKWWLKIWHSIKIQVTEKWVKIGPLHYLFIVQRKEWYLHAVKYNGKGPAIYIHTNTSEVHICTNICCLWFSVSSFKFVVCFIYPVFWCCVNPTKPNKILWNTHWRAIFINALTFKPEL